MKSVCNSDVNKIESSSSSETEENEEEEEDLPEIPFSRILALNKPEWYYMAGGEFCAIVRLSCASLQPNSLSVCRLSLLAIVAMFSTTS